MSLNEQKLWTDLGPVDSFPLGKPIPGRIEDEEVLVVNLDGKFHVFERKCPHQSRYLDECQIREGRIHCIYHMVTFSLDDGHIIDDGGYIGLPDLIIYRTKIQDDRLWASPAGQNPKEVI